MQEVAIVGAAGKMGSWFMHHFSRRGFEVYVYDINKLRVRMPRNVKVKDNLDDCVRHADLVIVCVPLNITPSVVKDCASKMKDRAIIAEISSVKKKTFEALKKVPTTLTPLCIHPMFGPGASDKTQARMLLVPVRNERNELKITRAVFDNARITVLPNAKQHDKSMAVVLGLTYFVNIVFARLLSLSDFSMLKQVSGTTFGLQSLISESILRDDPELIIALLQANTYTREYVMKYLKAATTLRRLVVSKDSSKVKEELRKTRLKLERSQDLQKSYKRMYDIIEGIK
ncbi:MAG TPA: prephenate dehydrogenase/arogenate dehydrogenase family protein [Nitrososphaera sp.]|jgi:prephenate dehydrogenase